VAEVQGGCTTHVCALWPYRFEVGPCSCTLASAWARIISVRLAYSKGDRRIGNPVLPPIKNGKG